MKMCLIRIISHSLQNHHPNNLLLIETVKFRNSRIALRVVEKRKAKDLILISNRKQSKFYLTQIQWDH